MSAAEVALELLKLALEKCPDVSSAVLKKEGFLQLYREFLAAARDRKE